MLGFRDAASEAVRPVTGRELGVAFCICFAAVASVNARLLHMPPVWDAVGVFAPAVYLYENGFDLGGLLALPGYLEGGPNIHSLSLVTLLTLGAMIGSGGQPDLFLPGLHLVHFAFAALTGAITFGLSQRLLGRFGAALVTAALLVFPTFLVQSGALHTETAGAALVMLSLASFAWRRFGWMTVFAVAACGVKSLGLLLLVPLTLGIAADRSMTTPRRLAWSSCLLIPAITVEAAKWAGAPPTSGEPGNLLEHLEAMLSHLANVPDLLVLLVLSSIVCADQIIRAFRTGIQETLDDDSRRTQLATALLPASCLAFVALLPLSGAAFIPLQRYYVWVLAPALITVSAALGALGGRRVAAGTLLGFVAFAGLNHGGRFYPKREETIRRFSVVERSYEYLDYYRAQQQGVRAVESLAEDRPAFVTRGEFYYLASPLMGWVDRHVRNVHFVLEPPYDSSHLSHFPRDFYVLEADSNRYHGQGVVLDLVAQADLRSDYEPRLAGEWTSGPYTTKLIHIRRKTGEGKESTN